MTPPKPCPQCELHRVHGIAQGIGVGIRRLAEAVARGDTNTAEDLIRMAYRHKQNGGNNAG